MKKWPFDQIFRLVIACCCLVVIGVLSVTNLPLMSKPVDRFLRGKTTFEEMTKTIASGLVSDDLAEKDGFINLNGLLARVAGRRVYNDVVRLNNGMLTRTETIKPSQLTSAADKIVALADWLGGKGTPFLYVMPPLKPDVAGEVLPTGVGNEINEDATVFLDAMASRGVSVLDLRSDLSANAGQLDMYQYYRTDHHWSPDGAIAGYDLIMRRMKLMDSSLTAAHTAVVQWDRHLIERWFLGSIGRRVGSLYAGVDPLVWYTPRFETEMSCAVPDRRYFYIGSFEQANIRERFIEKADYFHMNPYCVYIGGDYPLVKHRNAKAPNRCRVLIIKDSYALPVQAFLSTEFMELDVIDPRHYDWSSIAEYCEWTQPDFVVMLSSTTQAVKLTNTVVGIKKGSVNVTTGDWKPCLEQASVPLAAKQAAYNYARLGVKLEHGKTYRFSCADIIPQEGDAAGVSIILYDATEKTLAKCDLVDIGYCHEQGGAEWTFRVPSDDHEYQLLLYAGVHGATVGIGLTYTGVTVSVLE